MSDQAPVMGPEEWDDPFFLSIIGSYRIIGQIGSGTFGEVWIDDTSPFLWSKMPRLPAYL